MRSLVSPVAGALTCALLVAATPAQAQSPAHVAVVTGPATAGREWVLSRGTLPVGKDHVIGLKLDAYHVMWLGGVADDLVGSNRCFIYDIRTRTFRETAPIPAAKPIDQFATAGVLPDGSVVIAGGVVAGASTAVPNEQNQLSYRYDPRTDRWTRTGDLPEPQEWLFVPTTLLRDGRLLIAGGQGLDGLGTGAGSRDAFVFNLRQRSLVKAVDPRTGLPTGATTVVQGRWDYTRRTDGQVSRLTGAHLFGNAVLLKDGRVFVAGGHSTWDWRNTGASVLATGTDFFDPATGVWSSGPALPSVVGEDDRISGSHGGRTNGVGFALLDNGDVVLVGGYSQTDGASFFETAIARQSILVLTPAAEASRSRFRLAPHPIPPGTDFGGFFGDGGRSQVLTYAISRNRVVIAGGQDSFGEDLYDTYLLDGRDLSVRRGPDMAHGVAAWAAENPDFGYPADYQTATISTRAVSMANSKLVLAGDVLVHGGSYDGIGVTFLSSRYVEQLNPQPGGSP